jgi:hypothetical protein
VLKEQLVHKVLKEQQVHKVHKVILVLKEQ